MITDAAGMSLAVILAGGNRNDITQLLPLLGAVPPVRGLVGRPLRGRGVFMPTVATTSTGTAGCCAPSV